MKKTITLTLNGETRSVDVEPDERLLMVLREKLGVKTPKRGCGKGDCGVCSVLLDGKTVRSCLILAVEVDGHEITTLDGLVRNGPGPLQKALVEHNAFQCGFCAPAMTLSIVELLEANPEPTGEDIQEAISGNLCRCTGYQSIIDAVLDLKRGES